MVMINSPGPPPSSDSSLRGYNMAYGDYSDFITSYSDLKLRLCQMTMTQCAITLKEDRVCDIKNRCSGFYKRVIMPTTHSFCHFASNQCNDPELNRLLDQLYDAGAISENIEKSRAIDQQIRELNDLQHKTRMVVKASEAERARHAYIEERKQYHKHKHKTVRHTRSSDASIEEEEAYI